MPADSRDWWRRACPKCGARPGMPCVFRGLDYVTVPPHRERKSPRGDRVLGLSARDASVVWAVALLAVAGAIAGWGRLEGLRENLVAEAIVAGLGIPIALGVLARLDSQRRRQEWNAVSDQTLGTIATACHEISVEVWFALPQEARRGSRDPLLVPDGGLSKVVTRMAMAARHAAGLEFTKSTTSKDGPSTREQVVHMANGWLRFVLRLPYQPLRPLKR